MILVGSCYNLYLRTYIYIGDTRACFQSSGKIPRVNDRLKISDKKGEITFEVSFSNFVEILSNPAAALLELYILVIYYSLLELYITRDRSYIFCKMFIRLL